MGAIIPEFLRKGELIYEVESRGEKPCGDVRSLRTQLRALLNSPRSWQVSWEVESELIVCRDRMEELSGEIENLKTLPSINFRSGPYTQLLHWSARLKLLCGAPGLSEEERVWSQERAEELDRVLESFSASKSVGDVVKLFERNSGADEDKGGPSDLMKFAGVAQPVLGSSNAAMESSTGGAPPVNLISFGLTDNAVSSQASLPARQVFSDDSFKAFARLPHPLHSTLSSFPTVDGLDVNALLSFFERVLSMREFPGMSDVSLMELVAPFCRRPLGDCLLSCLKRGASFDTFHAEALDLFVPLRVMERMKVERVFRPQHPQETLSQYVGDIRTVGRVLRLSMPEQQLVDIVLQGLHPEERSRCIFGPRPSSFADLDRLAILSRSVQDADLQRVQWLGHRAQATSPAAVAPMGQIAESPQRQRGAVVCFGCGRAGHVRRDCRQGSRGGPKN